MLKSKKRIDSLEEDVKDLKEKINSMTDFILSQQDEINKLKKEDKEPKYFG